MAPVERTRASVRVFTGLSSDFILTHHGHELERRQHLTGRESGVFAVLPDAEMQLREVGSGV